MNQTDKPSIRQLNEQQILQLIINQKLISRADISKMTALNKATVSSIVDDLAKKNLITEVGIGDSKGGRKPVMFRFHSRAALSITLEIGHHLINSTLTYLDGETIESKQKYQTIQRSTIIETLIAAIKSHQKSAPDTAYGIIGITIAIHGIVAQDQIVFTPYYDLADLPIQETVSSYFQLPVHLENEANLTALAENAAFYQANSLISIRVGEGIGAGVIFDQHLIKGRNGYGGEIGHTIIVPNGKECPCGNYGCFEQYASEKSILREYSKAKGYPVSFAELKTDYEMNRFHAVKTIDTFISFMSIGLNNLLYSFNPDVVIVNSRFSNEIEGVLTKIRNSLNRQQQQIDAIYASALGESSVLLGGTFVNATSFLGIQSIHLQHKSD